MKKIFKEKYFWLYFFSFFLIVNILSVLLYKIFILLNPYPYTLKNKISVEFIFKKQLYYILNFENADWKRIIICCIRNFSAVLAFYSLILIAKYIMVSNQTKEKYKAIRNLIYGFLIFFIGLIFIRAKAMTKIFFLTSNNNLIDNFTTFFLLLMWHETLEYSAIIISSYITLVKTLLNLKIIKNINETTNRSFVSSCDSILETFRSIAIICLVLLFIAGYIEIQLTPIAKFYDSTPPFFNK